MTFNDGKALVAPPAASMPSAGTPTEVSPIHASSVLVVGDDPLQRAALVCAVLRTGVAAVLGASSSELRSLAAVLLPSVLLGTPGGNRALLREIADLLSRSARTAAIILGAPDHDELSRLIPTARDRLHGLGIPPPANDLARVIRRYCPAPGIAGPFSPAEYVQQAGLGGHSVALHCVDPAGRELGVIAMRGGHVHSAWHGSLRGFDAFAELVTRSDIRVLLGEVMDMDPDADLNDHWQCLVLESMRRYDERKHQTSERRSAPGEILLPEAGSDAPPDPKLEALTRAASIPALPVTEMREALGSTRGNSRPDVRELVEAGVRAVIEKDYPRAIHNLERALELDPRNASVRHRLVRLYATVAEKG